MVTIARGTVPADELVLSQTFEALPNINIEVERVVKSGEQTVMPLLWVRGTNADEFETHAIDDPGTDDVTRLADFGTEYLYRMTWIDRIQLLLQMITNSHASILDAYGADGTWSLRVFFPSRDDLNATHEFCEAHGLTFDVNRIREMDSEPKGRYGLTEDQYAALVTADEHGYFDVPRRTNLEELATQLDVSHQALSERIRRGCGALVEDTLIVGADPN